MAKYRFYGKNDGGHFEPSLQTKYHTNDLPGDINDDPEIINAIKFIENEPRGHGFREAIIKFQKNKWFGSVSYNVIGVPDSILKMRFMFGAVVQKDIARFDFGWSYKELKENVIKRVGEFVGYVHVIQTSHNCMVSMERPKRKFSMDMEKEWVE